MRAFLAAGLALLLVFGAAAPHVHVRGADHCVGCVVRQGDAARDETPDVAPRTFVAAAPPPDPGIAPLAGAPLGAVPGQSPPTGA